MITEAYCSFETVKLLKEKGFDEPVEWPFINKDNNITSAGSFEHLDHYDEYIPTYTHQRAMAWLRERGIHIMTTIGCDVDREPRIFYGAVIALFNDYGDIDYRDPLDDNGYDEPEDAVEAALLYVLQNLI